MSAGKGKAGGTGRRRMAASGWAWLALIGLPPLLILGLIVTVFVWQARRGEITPKWRKTRTPVTNAPMTGR